MQNATNWYIDPSYSNSKTLYRNGFTACVFPSSDGSDWCVQGYDEKNGAFSTGKTIFEFKGLRDEASAKMKAERKLSTLTRV